MDNNCFGCDYKDELINLNIIALVDEQLELEIDKVNAEEWEKRQRICRECPFRLNETCSKCGCFYRFRTALKNKQCPINNW